MLRRSFAISVAGSALLLARSPICASARSLSLASGTPSSSDASFMRPPGLPRLRVVMDLDECMVHSVFPDETEYRQEEDRKQVQLRVAGVDTVAFMCEDGAKVRMHLRPGLHRFLQEVNSFCDLYVFTAALPVYARPGLKLIDANQKIFKKIWYRDSCQIIRKYGFYTKNLKMVFGPDYVPERTILIDNNVLSFYANPSNGIHVSSFYDQAEDTELLALIPFLRNLDPDTDVRPRLTFLFKIQESLHIALSEDALR